MNSETKAVILGELAKKVEANQSGLLPLFKEESIPVIGPVRIHDIQMLLRKRPGAFKRAIEVLYPDSDFVNADGSYSAAAIYKGILSDEKDTSERLNDLGLGSVDGSKKYDPSKVTYNKLGTDYATISYQTIFKYTIIVGVAIGLFFLLRHYYKKMK